MPSFTSLMEPSERPAPGQRTASGFSVSSGSRPFRTAVYETALGFLMIGYAEEQVLSLTIRPSPAVPSAPCAFSDAAACQILEYLNGQRKAFSIPFRLEGTAFQTGVWKAIQDVPYGSTSTYTALAQAIGKPASVRAVASACGKNPVWLLVPCHRILGQDGRLHGYAGGLEMKQALLTLEKQALSSE